MQTLYEKCFQQLVLVIWKMCLIESPLSQYFTKKQNFESRVIHVFVVTIAIYFPFVLENLKRLFQREFDDMDNDFMIKRKASCKTNNAMITYFIVIETLFTFIIEKTHLMALLFLVTHF